jgi:hypothetical protein
VEVMVAIMLLTGAIIPMVAMFDTGLRVASRSGDYDQARALANQQMERVMALRYTEAFGNTTASPPTPGLYSPPSPACDISLPQGFTCQMNSYYVSETDLTRPSPALSSGNVVEVEVTINWNGQANSYTTTGLKSRGTQSS